MIGTRRQLKLSASAFAMQANVFRFALFALLLLVVCEPFVCRIACFSPSPRVAQVATIDTSASIDSAAALQVTATNQQEPASNAPQPGKLCAVGHTHIALAVVLLALVFISATRRNTTPRIVSLRHQPPQPLRRPPIAALFA